MERDLPILARNPLNHATLLLPQHATSIAPLSTGARAAGAFLFVFAVLGIRLRRRAATLVLRLLRLRGATEKEAAVPAEAGGATHLGGVDQGFAPHNCALGYDERRSFRDGRENDHRHQQYDNDCKLRRGGLDTVHLRGAALCLGRPARRFMVLFDQFQVMQ